jgi:hypothetical protein
MDSHRGQHNSMGAEKAQWWLLGWKTGLSDWVPGVQETNMSTALMGGYYLGYSCPGPRDSLNCPTFLLKFPWKKQHHNSLSHNNTLTNTISLSHIHRHTHTHRERESRRTASLLAGTLSGASF